MITLKTLSNTNVGKCGLTLNYKPFHNDTFARVRLRAQKKTQPKKARHDTFLPMTQEGTKIKIYFSCYRVHYKDRRAAKITNSQRRVKS